MSTVNSVGNGLSGATGSGSFVGSTSPTIVTPEIAQINDTSANTILLLNKVSSAVNYLEISNNSTTNPVELLAKGSDTNIALSLTGKGNSGVLSQGITSGSYASSGNTGEIILSQILYDSSVSFSSGSIKNLTSITLTAGNWLLFGNINWTCTESSITYGYIGISVTSATLADTSLFTVIPSTGISNNAVLSGNAVSYPVSITTTTTYYMVGQIGFSSGTASGCGLIYAVRI